MDHSTGEGVPLRLIATQRAAHVAATLFGITVR
jgi:hypothetical protein